MSLCKWEWEVSASEWRYSSVGPASRSALRSEEPALESESGKAQQSARPPKYKR